MPKKMLLAWLGTNNSEKEEDKNIRTQVKG